MISPSKTLPLLALFCCSTSLIAAEVWTGDQYYAAGYDAYVKNNYAACADYFFLAKTNDATKDNRAKLLLSFCQLMLGNKSYSAINFNKVSESELTDRERKVYKYIAKNASTEIAALNPPYYGWVMPFFAYGTFSSNSSKASLWNAGAAGGVSHDSWALNLSGEYLSLSSNSSTTTTTTNPPPGGPGSPPPAQSSTSAVSAYSQEQFSLGFTKTLTPAFWARLDTVYINTSSSSLGSTYIGGAALGWIPWIGTQLSVDYQYSAYPGLSLGKLSANEITVMLDQRIWSDLTTLLHTQLGVESIFASAPSTYDSTTSFTLKSNYERYVVNLELRVSSWVAAVEGWTGAEAFGVRDQGAAVYNTLEEHKFGGKAKLGYYVDPTALLQGAVSLEDFTASGIESQAYVGAVSLTLSF